MPKKKTQKQIKKEQKDLLIQHIKRDIINLQEQMTKAKDEEAKRMTELKYIREKKNEITGALKALDTLLYNIKEGEN